MSNVKNIIDTLKNQGANPDLSQINLIEKLCKMTDVKIPDTGEISLGVGSSVGYQDNRLIRPVILHITSGNGNHKHSVKITSI